MGLRPYGYIGKPVRAHKVRYYIDHYLAQAEQSKRTLTVTVMRVARELLMSDIMYIESRERRLLFHCVNGSEPLSSYCKLDEIQEKLDQRFIRCHQSYIVNAQYIKKITGEKLILLNDVELCVNRKYLQTVREQYFKYIGRSVL